VLSSSAPRNVLTFIVGAWAFYTTVWHTVLSNLPLHAPTPYGVHARFWMQPSILVCSLVGVGAASVAAFLTAALPGSQSRGGGAISSRNDVGKKNIRKPPPKTTNKNKSTTTTDTATSLPHTESASSRFKSLLDVALSGLLLAFVVGGRFQEQDRSVGGWALHKYASAVLASVPADGVLLSHTDLDWNPVRYLRQCEHERPDVIHLSLQLMPYAWFLKQQGPLYPKVNEPYP